MTESTRPTQPDHWSSAPAHTSRAVSTMSITRLSHASSIASQEAMKLGRKSQTLRRTGTKAFTTNASDTAPSSNSNQPMEPSLPVSVPQSRAR